MKRKSISDISWLVTEEEYRADSALSYSTLAKFERGGFNELTHLFDKVESPSLTFGSAVDSLLTGGEKEFNDRFIVAEFPSISDNLITIAKTLHARYGETCRSIDMISDDVLAEVGKECEFYANDKYANYRVKLIKEGCNEYYNLLYLSADKTIIDTQTYNDVIKAVEVLKTSETTRDIFFENNPFTPAIEGFYQLKFKATLNGIAYRCMFDRINVDHENKTIQPIDLKTSYKKEWDFYKSFIEWNYQIQNRLYYRILLENIKKDPYYKDFKILPYKDVVINKISLTPLVWDCDFTPAMGTLTFGKNNQIVMRDPEEIGKELHYYLTTASRVPIGVNMKEGNDLRTWMNKMI
jgi:hypothetical protein